MIKPVFQDDVFLEDVFRAKQNTEQLHLWWLGQSGFLIQWQGNHLLFLILSQRNTRVPISRMCG